MKRSISLSAALDLLVSGILAVALLSTSGIGSQAQAAPPGGDLASYLGDKLPNRGDGGWVRLGGTTGEPVAANGILTLQGGPGARATVVYEKHRVFTQIGTPYTVSAVVRLAPEVQVTAGAHQFTAYSTDAVYEGSFVNAKVFVDGAEVAGSVRIDYSVGAGGQLREIQPASWTNAFHVVELRFNGTTQSLWVDGVEKVSAPQGTIGGHENRLRWSMDTITNDGTGRIQLDSLNAAAR